MKQTFFIFCLFGVFLLFAEKLPEPAPPSSSKGGESAPNLLDANSALKQLEAKEQILEKWANIKPPKGSAKYLQKDAETKKVVEEIIDYRFISQYILGKKWAAASEKQKQNLFNKIKELYTEVYLEKIFYDKSYEKRYLDKGTEKRRLKGVPESVFITSEIHAVLNGKNVIYELVYHLRLVDGVYKIFDIELDTVSLARNYKEQFAKKLKTQTIDELIELLDKEIKSKKREGSAPSPKTEK